MPGLRIQEAASWRLDAIYRYTRERWGEAQANRYVTGLFDALERIESHGVASKPVPAEFGVEGFFLRYERHFVYWRRLSNGDIGIVTILHERMHQIGPFREDFFGATYPTDAGGLTARGQRPSRCASATAPPL